MTTTERILELISKSGKSANYIMGKCNIRHNAPTEWAKGKGSPSTEAVAKIALYFNVSTDYLIGLTDNPKPHYE